ncbi:MAG: UDP-2,4-diacetamido-2,4,6-trideoxy-beta-L-altropyranose hydrolase [Paraglaciecola sp.]|jgi:UDP-2,4-diacetamido-2,4,6-trideoxy-beta-L-altropyranose hydrolase
MNILFRVDANSSIGMGHLMRCLALAQALDKWNIQSFFAVDSSTQALCKSRRDWCGEILLLPEHIEATAETAWIEKMLIDQQIDALVLDGYQFGQAYRQGLSRLNCPLILFDDNNESGALYAKLVINGAENAPALGYQQTAPAADYCLGAQYRVLRQEFIHQIPSQWQARHLLTLCMGGSDPKQLSLPLLKALEAQGFTGPICLITGDAYQGLAQLQSVLQHSAMTVQHIHNCQVMASVFSQSRLVVSAAGGSQFELLACQSPSVLLVVADNQVNATLQAAQQGWCEMGDLRSEVNFKALAKQVAALWADEKSLRAMHQQAQTHSDVQGAERVVRAIISLLQRDNLPAQGGN